MNRNLLLNDVYITTFATKDFSKFRNDLIESARQFGIFNDFSFTERDLVHSNFYKRNEKIFLQKRGFGNWLWKPYFILQTLNKVKYNEILFYIDAGSKIIKDPLPLINLARSNDSGIMLFNHRPVLTKEFTKRDTFILMSCDSQVFWNAPIIMAGIMLLRKTDFTLNFISEWLKECENENALSDKANIIGTNFPEFIAHREDQSILSILVQKHGIKTYRDPSKWGNFLKMKEFREPSELVCFPWRLNNSINNYSEVPDATSPYGTIFELNRKQEAERTSPQKQTYYEKFLNKFINIKEGKGKAKI